MRSTAGGEGDTSAEELLSLSMPTHLGPLTEVVQAMVVDGTAADIHSLHRHRVELDKLWREMGTPIWPDPLLVLKPGRVGGKVSSTHPHPPYKEVAVLSGALPHRPCSTAFCLTA